MIAFLPRCFDRSSLSYLCVYQPVSGREGCLIAMLMCYIHLACLRDERMRCMLSVCAPLSAMFALVLRYEGKVSHLLFTSLKFGVCLCHQSSGRCNRELNKLSHYLLRTMVLRLHWSRSLCHILIPFTSKCALNYSRSINYTNTPVTVSAHFCPRSRAYRVMSN